MKARHYCELCDVELNFVDLGWESPHLTHKACGTQVRPLLSREESAQIAEAVFTRIIRGEPEPTR